MAYYKIRTKLTHQPLYFLAGIEQESACLVAYEEHLRRAHSKVTTSNVETYCYLTWGILMLWPTISLPVCLDQL